MVARTQHRWHLHAAEGGGPGVVGVLQQQGAVAFFVEGGGRSHRARQEPHHAVDDRGGGQLAPGEHKIADRDLFVGQGAYAFVEPLVVAAKEHQLVVVRGPADQVCLHQGLPLGTHQQHPSLGQHR